MSDIYVKPYKEPSRRPWMIFLVLTLILTFALVIRGAWIWINSHSKKLEKTDMMPTQSIAFTSVISNDNLKIQQEFTQAQGLVDSGKLSEASTLLEKVISTTTDKHLKNNAIRIQGRLNTQLFFSDAPIPKKKSYVIQPGDSLDRIARKNKTTVALIRKMNRIKGNLIYPGTRILLPVCPFEIHVDKSEKTLNLTLDLTLFKRYAVGLGRYGKTPLGVFHTVVHQSNPDWTPPGGGIIPFGDPRNVLGTRWISISDIERPEIKGFGIHGTSNRESIGEESSNGCIRMLNEDVEELFLFIPRGTKVVISE